MTLLKLRFFLLIPIVVLFGSRPAALQAQVAPSAFKGPFSLTAGVFASGFDPDWFPNKLVGAGAYVDVNLFRNIGVEGEGRWLSIHGYQGVTQDNYLIGPRVTLKHFWRATPYVKVLGGLSHMNFEDNIGHGRFTTIAFGGGIDLHLSRHWRVRAIDAEYQDWPKFLPGTSLYPYGLSAGIGYRFF